MSGQELAFLLAALVVMGAVAAWVSQPLWERRRPAAPAQAPPLELLLRRRAAVLELRDLEAERSSGRVEEAEYARRRAAVLLAGAAALAEIDRWAGEQADARRVRLARVEADVAAVRMGGGLPRRCDGCGGPLEAGDRFCRSCGRNVALAGPEGVERASSEADSDG